MSSDSSHLSSSQEEPLASPTASPAEQENELSKEVRFIDTTLRDGQQSLWAMRMRTGAMLPALRDIDAAGYDGIEFTVPAAQFATMVRTMNEDPWVWLRRGAGLAARTPLRMHAGPESPFHDVPVCVQRLLLDKLSELGFRVTRISDWWNNFDRLRSKMRLLSEYGIASVVNVIYSVSPRHSHEYYTHRFSAAAELRPHRICFKDVGGLLTPEVASELLPAVANCAEGVELEFHAHCNSGLAPYCVVIAAASGLPVIHTAIPPLANGSSLPSVFAAVNNLSASGLHPRIDLVPLRRVSAHFQQVALDDDLPTGEVAEYDERLFQHQIPGGMISHLRLQLQEVRKADKIDETLEETARIREEFGFPIMVTPLSQFIGSQAAINVTTGSRYGVVTDETIQYALGLWGSEAVDLMNEDVRERILDRPRARSIAASAERVDPDPSLSQVRHRYGSTLSDEELVARVYAGIGAEKKELSRDNPTSTYEEYLSARHPLRVLLRRLSATDVRTFAWQDRNHSLFVRR